MRPWAFLDAQLVRRGFVCVLLLKTADYALGLHHRLCNAFERSGTVAIGTG